MMLQRVALSSAALIAALATSASAYLGAEKLLHFRCRDGVTTDDYRVGHTSPHGGGGQRPLAHSRLAGYQLVVGLAAGENNLGIQAGVAEVLIPIRLTTDHLDMMTLRCESATSASGQESVINRSLACNLWLKNHLSRYWK